MITKKALELAYNDGAVSIIDSPNNDGAVCRIHYVGNDTIDKNWFYFGGEEATHMSAKEYVENVPKADIIDEIFNSLEHFRTESVTFGTEYNIYTKILNKYIEEAQRKTNKNLASDVVADLTYYLQTNSEKGVTWFPNFVIEDCIEKLIQIE